MSSNRLKVLLVSLLAVFAISAVASSSAFAVEGPHWWVTGCIKTTEFPIKEPPTKYDDNTCSTKAKLLAERKWERAGALVELKTGESVKVVSKNTTNFTLSTKVSGLTITIVCKTVKDKSTLFGGWPGTDENVIVFSECSVTSPPGEGCEVNEPIEVNTKTKLVFLSRKKAGEAWKVQTEKEYEEAPGKGEERAIGDEFKPANPPNFVELTIHGCTGGASVLNKTYAITGTDTGIANGALLEFNKETSGLFFGGNKASLTGTTKQEIEGGGTVEAVK